MDIQQILKVLKNERECIARQSRPLGEMPQCRKDDDGVKLCEYCDLCLPDDEILEVYDFLINGYELLQNEGAESYTIKCTEPLSEEQIARFKEEWSNASFTASFEPMQFPEGLVAVMPDEYGREHFKGICPYTNKKCEKWTCSVCEVEKRERKFMEGDND